MDKVFWFVIFATNFGPNRVSHNEVSLANNVRVNHVYNIEIKLQNQNNIEEKVLLCKYELLRVTV